MADTATRVAGLVLVVSTAATAAVATAVATTTTAAAERGAALGAVAGNVTNLTALKGETDKS